MVQSNDIASWWPSLYDPLRGLGQKIADWFAPKSDAAATESCYEINMELPGVSADDISIALENGQLTIKGHKHSEREEKGKRYYFSEREFGAFQRSFRLPADAKADGVTADFSQGVLMLKIPKAGPPPDTSKKIEIRNS